MSTLVNVYVALPVFTPVAGSSYTHFMEQNGGAQYVNSEFGRYFHFCWYNNNNKVFISRY